MSDEDKYGNSDTELTAEERSGLDALAREAVPPAELEDQIVHALASRGLLARRPRWWLAVASVAAAVILFLAGYATGARRDEQRDDPRAAVALPGRQYVLFLYETADFQNAPPDDPNQVVREYRGWAEEIFDRGQLVGGERLADDGWTLGASAAGIQFDRRIPRAPEGVVSGYFLIDAVNDEEALAIAESHPHLRRRGHIALRALDPIQ